MHQEKVVGEPDAGKPHVRFEVAGSGNQSKEEILRHSQRKRSATSCLVLNSRRHSLTLPVRPAPLAALDTIGCILTGRFDVLMPFSGAGG